MSIGHVQWPEGYDRTVLDSVDSTLDEARRRAAQVVAQEWILAHEQTAARGRRGRAWRHPKGNFAATLVLRLNDMSPTVALRSFVAAVALRDAVADVAGPNCHLALKWPNDVLLNGGKVAGILLETIGGHIGQHHLAIGVGANLVAAPGASDVEDRALRPVSLLSETGASVDPEDFLLHLAAAYARYETQFLTFGFAPIRSEWLSHAAKLGEVITARLPNEEITGTFVDVDKDGQLVLETAKGRAVIAAADVFF